MSIFEKIKAALSSETDKLRGIRRQIAEQSLQRERLLNSPAHREDLLAMLGHWIAGNKATVQKDLLGNLRPFFRTPHTTAAPAQGRAHAFSFVGVANGSPAAGQTNVTQAQMDAVLCTLFGDQIAAIVGKVIDEMEIPADALPMSKRQAAVDRIDAELAVLRRQEADLVAAFEEAGLLVPD